MWWILHKKNRGAKPSGGPPQFIITGTCPNSFRNAVRKILSPEELDRLDTPDSDYELLITNRVTKEVVGLVPKGSGKKEELNNSTEH